VQTRVGGLRLTKYPLSDACSARSIPESEWLQLSGLQHYAFCPRQWGLIYVEGLWVENLLTHQGREMHQRADSGPPVESRAGTITCRSIPLSSRHLGLAGRADVIEFYRCDHEAACEGVELPGREGRWVPYPVEYKRGRPKTTDCDALQLCAQALCFEEMTGADIREGAIFYGRTKRRQRVNLDERLRIAVARLVGEMHVLQREQRTPEVPKGQTGCGRCSMAEICLPRGRTGGRVRRYFRSLFVDEEETSRNAGLA
jgi:CRISPR-associated exonuclease Cas4